MIRPLLAAILLTTTFTVQAAGCLGKEALAAAKTFATQQRDFYRVEAMQLHGLVEARLLAALSAEQRCREERSCAIQTDPWAGAPRKTGGFALLSGNEQRAAVELRNAEQPVLRLKLVRGSPRACWLVADLIRPDGTSLVAQIEDWHGTNAPGVYLPLPSSASDLPLREMEDLPILPAPDRP